MFITRMKVTGSKIVEHENMQVFIWTKTARDSLKMKMFCLA